MPKIGKTAIARSGTCTVLDGSAENNWLHTPVRSWGEAIMPANVPQGTVTCPANPDHRVTGIVNGSEADVPCPIEQDIAAVPDPDPRFGTRQEHKVSRRPLTKLVSEHGHEELVLINSRLGAATSMSGFIRSDGSAQPYLVRLFSPEFVSLCTL